MKKLAVLITLILAVALSGCTPDETLYTTATVESGNITVDGEVSLTTDQEIIAIPHEWDAMESGHVYYYKGWQDVDGLGVTVDYLWHTPELNGGNVFARWDIAGESEFTINLYEGVTVSDNGTPFTTLSTNRQLDSTPLVKSYTSPTLAGGSLGDGAQGGDLVWSGKIGSGRIAVVGAENVLWFLVKSDTNYWFEIIHDVAGVHWIDYNFYWHEHDILTD
jgi:hypothetical protein